MQNEFLISISASLGLFAILIFIVAKLKTRDLKKGIAWKIYALWPVATLGWSIYRYDINKISDNKIYSAYIVFVIAFGFLSVYQGFIRRRCGECGAPSPNLRYSKEIDRWIGSKTVSDRTVTGKGKNAKEKIVQKTIAVTFIKIEECYSCNQCNNEWIEIRKSEL